jgi:tetratricopeptide (TPR) repeat protein
MTRQPLDRHGGAPGRSRYPGTRPFRDSAEDRARFFGRAQEGEQLYLRVLSVPVVLHFGKSGLGKTSLLQAWLSPRLREKAFLPVMVRLNVPTETVTLAVARALRQACEAEGLEYVGGETQGLWELLSTTIVWRDDLLLTPVLVFDQFEEVFTIRDAGCRAEIAAELGAITSGVAPDRVRTAGAAAASARPNVKIVISVREDYLGELDQFSAALPGLFHERVRLEPLTEKDAREAVAGPAQLLAKPGEEPYWTPPFTFEAAALDSILAYLRSSAGAIEPFELQLLCRYAETVAHMKAEGSAGPVALTQADLKGTRAFDGALRNFYRNTLHRLPARQRARARRLCERGLLGVSGHRLMLEEAQIREQFHVNTESLRALAEQRLIRRELRLNSAFYEISHDRLADTIFQTRKFKIPRWLRRAAQAAVAIVFLIGFGVYSLVASYEQAQGRMLEARERMLGDTEDLLTLTLFTLRDELPALGDRGTDLLEDTTQVSLEFLNRQMPTDAPQIRRMRAVASTTMGDVFREREDPDGALEWYREALDIDEQLLAENPSDTLTRKDVMIDYERIGSALIDLADLSGALDAYGRARDTGSASDDQEEAPDPLLTRQRAQELLARGDEQIVEHPMDALRLYLQSLATLERLASRDAEPRIVHDLLIAAHGRIGDVAVRASQPAVGLPSLQIAVQLSEQLAAAEPANPKWQNGLSWHLVLLGRAHLALGHSEQARKVLERAVAVMKPVVPRQRDVAYLDTYAQALLMLGRTAEAAPIVAELRSQGWKDPAFLDLCQKAGL